MRTRRHADTEEAVQLRAHPPAKRAKKGSASARRGSAEHGKVLEGSGSGGTIVRLPLQPAVDEDSDSPLPKSVNQRIAEQGTSAASSSSSSSFHPPPIPGREPLASEEDLEGELDGASRSLPPSTPLAKNADLELGVEDANFGPSAPQNKETPRQFLRKEGYPTYGECALGIQDCKLVRGAAAVCTNPADIPEEQRKALRKTAHICRVCFVPTHSLCGVCANEANVKDLPAGLQDPPPILCSRKCARVFLVSFARTRESPGM